MEGFRDLASGLLDCGRGLGTHQERGRKEGPEGYRRAPHGEP